MPALAGASAGDSAVLCPAFPCRLCSAANAEWELFPSQKLSDPHLPFRRLHAALVCSLSPVACLLQVPNSSFSCLWEVTPSMVEAPFLQPLVLQAFVGLTDPTALSCPSPGCLPDLLKTNLILAALGLCWEPTPLHRVELKSRMPPGPER